MCDLQAEIYGSMECRELRKSQNGSELDIIIRQNQKLAPSVKETIQYRAIARLQLITMQTYKYAIPRPSQPTFSTQRGDGFSFPVVDAFQLA